MGKGTRGDFSEIPQLDVSALYGDDENAIKATAKEMRAHLETTGFLYVVGHPISIEQIESVREMSRKFFALPEDEKLKLRIDKNFRGYLPFAGSTIVTSSVEKVTKPNQSESIFFMHEVATDDPRALAGRAAARSEPVARGKRPARLSRHDRSLCRCHVDAGPQDGPRHRDRA